MDENRGKNPILYDDETKKCTNGPEKEQRIYILNNTTSEQFIIISSFLEYEPILIEQIANLIKEIGSKKTIILIIKYNNSEISRYDLIQLINNEIGRKVSLKGLISKVKGFFDGIIKN